MVHCQSETIFLGDALLKFQNYFFETYGINLWHCVSSPGYSLNCSFYETKH